VWTFPADLPLSELEDRLSNRLTTEYDLAESIVTIDNRGRASLAAAPAPGSLSQRVPDGHRAVSVDGLVPTGIARGDELLVVLDDETVEGTVLSARSETGDHPRSPSPSTPRTAGNTNEIGEGDDERIEVPARAPTTRGGEGRVTVAVDREAAPRVLGADSAQFVVRSRGSGREFELVSMLARTGTRFRRLVVPEASSLAGKTLEDAALRETYGVIVLGIRSANGWSIAPRKGARLTPGDEVMAVGTRPDLDAFQAVVA
jgi:hypothetical protein